MTGIQLYQIDPSGTYLKGNGFAIGYASDTAIEVIQKGYNKDITIENALDLFMTQRQMPIQLHPMVATKMIAALVAEAVVAAAPMTMTMQLKIIMRSQATNLIKDLIL